MTSYSINRKRHLAKEINCKLEGNTLICWDVKTNEVLNVVVMEESNGKDREESLQAEAEVSDDSQERD